MRYKTIRDSGTEAEGSVMRSQLLTLIIACSATWLTSLGLVATAQTVSPSQISFEIRNVRLFDGHEVHFNRTVVIDGGVIRDIGDETLDSGAAITIDGTGHTLLPGLFDSHVHLPGFNTEVALAQNLALGVTTVVDMFSAGETLESLNELQQRDDPAHASLLVSGTGATATGGHPSQMSPEVFPTIDRPQDASQFVRDRISEGSDFLKIIYDDLSGLPMIEEETLRALVREAHARGLLTVVHITTEAQARTAIDAGIDGLAHLFRRSAATEGFGELVADSGVFVIPTLSVLRSSCGIPDGPQLLEDPHIRSFVEPQYRNLASMSLAGNAGTSDCTALRPTMNQLLEAGVTVLTGTDAALPGTAYGASVHGELAALVQLGMTPVQALAAATSAPAAVFGLDDRGTIEPGKRADLVLIEGDPTRDIGDSTRIVQVWKRGIQVDRQLFE